MRRLASAIFALVFAAGCTGRDGAHDAGDSARGLVRIDLTYTHVASAPASDVRFDAQARFIRYRAFDSSSVPTILGFADYDALPLDGCRVADGTAELDVALGPDAAGPGAEVALLDAGRLDVRGPIDRAGMMPRHYPELVPFVSGVVYGGDELSQLSLGLGQTYQVSGDGGVEVGGFSTAVTAPRAFPGLAVDPLHRGGDLDLRWSTDGAAGEPLYVEVKWSSRTGTRAVRCRARDNGFFSISRGAFEGLPATTALTSATVTLTRLARSGVIAPGAGRGELTLALSDLAQLQVIP
jgi:hypothetical protein